MIASLHKESWKARNPLVRLSGVEEILVVIRFQSNCRRHVVDTMLLCNSHKDDSTLVVRARDPEIRTRRVESFRSFQRSRCVTRLLSDPRHVAASLEAQETMPDDAKERLRKSLQSSLRQTLLRLVTVLDISEVGTSKLLSVPVRHLHTLVPRLECRRRLTCAEQWASLAEALGGRKRSSSRRRTQCRVGGASLRAQLASASAVHCCASPRRGYFAEVHGVRAHQFIQLALRSPSHWKKSGFDSGWWTRSLPQTAPTKVLLQERRQWRVHDWITSDSLDFCDHKLRRVRCAVSGGSELCTHGKLKFACSLCDSLVKRRKKF